MPNQPTPGSDDRLYLKNELLDGLGRMVFQLLSELWITRDRLAVVEQLLADKGVVQAGEADRYTPPAEVADRIEALRKLMVDNVLGAPTRDQLTVADLVQTGQVMREAEA